MQTLAAYIGDPLGLVAVNTAGDAQAQVLAVSVGGNATANGYEALPGGVLPGIGYGTGVSTGPSATGSAVAVDPEGTACAGGDGTVPIIWPASIALPGLLVGGAAVSATGNTTCGSKVAVSGTGTASGQYAVSGSGAASGQNSAISGTGPASGNGYVVASGLGSTSGSSTVVASGTQNVSGIHTASVSGTGSAECESWWLTSCAAVSPTGSADAQYNDAVGVSGTGSANGSNHGALGVSGTGPANGFESGISGAGPASGSASAVSVLGGSTTDCGTAVSGTDRATNSSSGGGTCTHATNIDGSGDVTVSGTTVMSNSGLANSPAAAVEAPFTYSWVPTPAQAEEMAAKTQESVEYQSLADGMLAQKTIYGLPSPQLTSKTNATSDPITCSGVQGQYQTYECCMPTSQAGQNVCGGWIGYVPQIADFQQETPWTCVPEATLDFFGNLWGPQLLPVVLPGGGWNGTGISDTEWWMAFALHTQAPANRPPDYPQTGDPNGYGSGTVTRNAVHVINGYFNLPDPVIYQSAKDIGGVDRLEGTVMRDVNEWGYGVMASVDYGRMTGQTSSGALHAVLIEGYNWESPDQPQSGNFTVADPASRDPLSNDGTILVSFDDMYAAIQAEAAENPAPGNDGIIY